jgi:hypothetical protein
MPPAARPAGRTAWGLTWLSFALLPLVAILPMATRALEWSDDMLLALGALLPAGMVAAAFGCWMLATASSRPPLGRASQWANVASAAVWVALTGWTYWATLDMAANGAP